MSSHTPLTTTSRTPTHTIPPRSVTSTEIALGTDVGPIAIGAHALVFPSAALPGAPWNAVVSRGFSHNDSSVVAKTQFPHGMINWVAADETGWIYYVDQSQVQSDTSPSVLWRVVAVDPATGAKQELASNGNTPDAFVPIVHAAQGWAYWTSAEDDRTAREQLWKPGWDRPRNLLRHTEMTPGSETLMGNHLVYLGPAATGAAGHTVGGDCWSVPLTGGTPAALTHSALVLGCSASGNWLVSQQHLDPHVSSPAEGVLDDPYEIWAQNGTNEPKLLHHGYVSSAPIYVGGDYAAWQRSDGKRVIQNLADPKMLQIVKTGGPARSAALSSTTLAVAHDMGDHVGAEIVALPTN